MAKQGRFTSVTRTSLTASRTLTAEDRGLRDINTWHQNSVDAHRQRLRDDGLDEAAVETAMAPIITLADNITQRMRDDYLARRP